MATALCILMIIPFCHLDCFYLLHYKIEFYVLLEFMDENQCACITNKFSKAKVCLGFAVVYTIKICTKIITVMTLSFRTDRSGKKVQTQIRQLLEEQSDQGLHRLLFHLHCLEAFLCCKANLLEFKGDYSKILVVQKFRTFTVFHSLLFQLQGHICRTPFLNSHI